MLHPPLTNYLDKTARRAKMFNLAQSVGIRRLLG
jgi:hypothetical protein